MVLIGLAVLSRYVPSTLSTAGGQGGDIVIKKIKAIGNNKYEATLVLNQNGKESTLTTQQRSTLDFYILDLEKTTLDSIQPSTSMKGTYVINSKNTGTLLVVDNRVYQHPAFVTMPLQPTNKKIKLLSEGLMTKEVGGITVTCLYKELTATKSTTLRFQVEGTDVKAKNIIIVDQELAYFQIFNENIVKGEIVVDETFPHEGLYVVFVNVQKNGKVITIPYKFYVDKGLKG